MEEEINKDINKQWGVSASMITFARQTPVHHLSSFWKTDSRRKNESWPISKIVIIAIFDRQLIAVLLKSVGANLLVCWQRYNFLFLFFKKVNKNIGENFPPLFSSLYLYGMLIWMPEKSHCNLASLPLSLNVFHFPLFSRCMVWD